MLRFRDILEEEEVSKLLEGLDFQSSFDEWSAKVESVIALVSERKKKKKCSSVEIWIKHKRTRFTISRSRFQDFISHRRLKIQMNIYNFTYN